MTTKARPKENQHGFQPIYYFSRFVGLWPFTITYKLDRSIKTARIYLFDSFWFFISICLYLTALFYTYKDFQYTENTEENYLIASLMTLTSDVLPLLLGCVGIVLDMFNRNRLVNIIKMFVIFDKEVRSFSQ